MTQFRLSASTERNIQQRAHRYVAHVREQRSSYFNAFIQQFDLSSSQGLALMGLAEALIRVPDAATANALIYDKLSDQEWGNAWDQQLASNSPALSRLASNSLSLASHWLEEPVEPSTLQQVVIDTIKQSSRPIIRKALKEAMKYLGQHFVCAETIEQAVKQNQAIALQRVSYSYDMLGEAALCQDDVDRYLSAYHDAIIHVADTNSSSSICCDSISIKLSALHPNFHGLKQQDVMSKLGARILLLAQFAHEHQVDITIDAEEADRQSLSLHLFEYCLRHPSIKGWGQLGIAVQTYSKNALTILKQLHTLAKTFKTRIPVRLVKGAYWDYEIKQAQALALSDYPVYTQKCETDINYIACAQYLFRADIEPFLISRFASHNAYTLAAVIELAGQRPIEIQRLYGMGDSLHEAALNDSSTISSRVYSPVGNQHLLLPYLIRRLLENGANSSFVHQLFDQHVDDDALLLSPFDAESKPIFNLAKPTECLSDSFSSARGYAVRDSAELEMLLVQVKPFYLNNWNATPLIPNSDHAGFRNYPVNKPYNQQQIGTVSFVSSSDVSIAIDNAYKAFPQWSTSAHEKRIRCLLQAADLLQAAMPKFIALLQIEAGKTLQDAIDEVREAIDFCRYYAQQMRDHYTNEQLLSHISGEHNSLSYEARGVFACISPWNFPLAIFMGQIAAALLTGNTVLAKPAEATSIIAYEAVLLLHQAGIPKNVLQLLPGVGVEIGEVLCADERVNGVVFTGSSRAAKQLQRGLAQREGAIATLIAETGGQNAMIVDSTVLAEQVVKDVIQSSFHSAGQRCSALRVLYLQDDIADHIIRLLKGAMQELIVGNPEYPETDVGPIISQVAQQDLQDHIEDCKKQHYQCLAQAPESTDANGYYVLPSVFEITKISDLKKEHFGPILHVMRYSREDIDTIIDDINNIGYGLTFGVHSRNQRFCDDIAHRVHVGNVYINRNIVGARVGCQPFGGRGLSGTGPKAGGPNYLKQFMTEKTITVNTSAIGGDAELMK